MDKLNNELLFSEKPLKIAFIVTEKGKNASAGDYFTAIEFSEALKHFGWEIIYLSERGPENWYEIPEDVDVLISLLPNYDINRIECSNKYLIKIAWTRNWFDEWISLSYFQNYDIIFASSETACRYIKTETCLNPILLPIGTNPNRFKDDSRLNKEYICDYCFTGSYWNVPREIIEMLDPDSLPYIFKLYGKNWEKIGKMQKYHHGFINYGDLPDVYKSTKIVIDDANSATKNYGAVNSRVYDAIVSGNLVLTNGELGSKETFEGKLPVFKSKKELNSLIKYYLTNEDARIEKVNELQRFILENHTYKNRANTLKNILRSYINKKKISIKIPLDRLEEIQKIDKQHLILGMKKELECNDCDVKIQILSKREEFNEDLDRDVIIVLSDNNLYEPKPYHYNILWNIFNPDKINIKKYNKYDHVFMGSKSGFEKMAKKIVVPTDIIIPDENMDYYKILKLINNIESS